MALNEKGRQQMQHPEIDEIDREMNAMVNKQEAEMQKRIKIPADKELMQELHKLQ